MKIEIANFEINFSDEKIRNFLASKGYTLEEHSLPTYFGITEGFSKYTLALKRDEEISTDKEYISIFKKEIRNNIENMLLAV